MGGMACPRTQREAALSCRSKLRPTVAPRWSADLAPAEVVANLRTAFNKGEPIGIRVPVSVRPKAAASKDSHFDVFLRRDETAPSDRPEFIREGIIIPDVRS